MSIDIRRTEINRSGRFAVSFQLKIYGSQAKVGSMTAGWEHFADWKRINSEGEQGVISLETLIRGTCERLGVFWHTQGSGKSFSMSFFSQKVLRKVTGNWTFLVRSKRRVVILPT